MLRLYHAWSAETCMDLADDGQCDRLRSARADVETDRSDEPRMQTFGRGSELVQQAAAARRWSQEAEVRRTRGSGEDP